MPRFQTYFPAREMDPLLGHLRGPLTRLESTHSVQHYVAKLKLLGYTEARLSNNTGSS